MFKQTCYGKVKLRPAYEIYILLFIPMQ